MSDLYAEPVSLPPEQLLPVRPVRRAYEQVSDQLRDLLIHGIVFPGDRLPSEIELSERFNVSRGTVREALRTLASEGLVITTRGAAGGTFAAVPKTSEVVQSLTGTISLMAGSREVTMAELLEAREQLEVPATRLAALRRTDAELRLIRAAVPDVTLQVGRTQIFDINRTFHERVVAAAGNRLLRVMTEPVFVTLNVRFLRDQAGPKSWDQVLDEHRLIYAAIEHGDGEAAASAMAQHLGRLRPIYEATDPGVSIRDDDRAELDSPA
jgi:DNA-binding FadR family transcriptional regulator